MEVSEATYIEFYQMQRRQKYIDERSKDNKDIFYNSLTTDEFNGEDILVDDSETVEEQAIRNVTAEEISFIISLLKPADQDWFKLCFSNVFLSVSMQKDAVLIVTQYISVRFGF